MRTNKPSYLIIFSILASLPVLTGVNGCPTSTDSHSLNPAGEFYVEGTSEVTLSTQYRSETLNTQTVLPSYWPSVDAIRAATTMNVRVAERLTDQTVVTLNQLSGEIVRIPLDKTGRGSGLLVSQKERVSDGCFLITSEQVHVQFNEAGDEFELSYSTNWYYDSVVTEHVPCPLYLENYAANLMVIGSPDQYANLRDRLFVSTQALSLERMPELLNLKLTHHYVGSRVSE
ncbi:MAG TPA: hypothetical protein PLH57_02350 [Oligoflexia bacterium]|nr:hypothetical protein [Oligoflexia bacterium]